MASLCKLAMLYAAFSLLQASAVLQTENSEDEMHTESCIQRTSTRLSFEDIFLFPVAAAVTTIVLLTIAINRVLRCCVHRNRSGWKNLISRASGLAVRVGIGCFIGNGVTVVAVQESARDDNSREELKIKSEVVI